MQHELNDFQIRSMKDDVAGLNDVAMIRNMTENGIFVAMETYMRSTHKKLTISFAVEKKFTIDEKHSVIAI